MYELTNYEKEHNEGAKVDAIESFIIIWKRLVNPLMPNIIFHFWIGQAHFRLNMLKGFLE